MTKLTENSKAPLLCLQNNNVYFKKKICKQLKCIAHAKKPHQTF